MSLVLVLLLVGTAIADYPHSVVLDEQGQVQLSWSYDSKTITFELRAPSSGWIALGISPNGGMAGSDIALGWVDNTGKAQLHDLYATGRQRPTSDAKQNLRLISGSECNGETVLTFSRDLRSCDSTNDMDITDGTMRMIYAYNPTDPSDINAISYHGSNRGTKSLRLLEPKQKTVQAPPDAKSIKFTNPNVIVPSASTTYWCQSFAFPKLQKKNHVIQIRPIITKGNEGLVHHILIYRCFNKVSSKHHGVGGVCFRRNMPSDLRQCFNVWAAWAVGGGDFILPEHVGFPVGAGDGPDFLVMETHFDNPQRKSGIRDSSGLEFVITPTLRKHDAGLLELGEIVSKSHLIPPHFNEFVSRSFCPDECLNTAMKDASLNKITVFASTLHAHLLGRKMYTHLIRNNKEVESLGYDHHYDFDLQETRTLPKEVDVYPTDRIAVDCVYDSSERKSVTTGGQSTQHEMCLTYLFYYPATKLTNCRSGSVPSGYLKLAGATGINQKTWSATSPANMAGKSFMQLFSGLNWNSQTVRNKFQKAILSENWNRYYDCRLAGKNVIKRRASRQKAFQSMAEPKAQTCASQPVFTTSAGQCRATARPRPTTARPEYPTIKLEKPKVPLVG